MLGENTSIVAPPAAQASRFRYNPALDGLRAVAVLAVIVGHAGIPQIGGYHGVTVFFVLSGYLITSLLLREIHTVGAVNLRHFYWRRAARLGPAMVLAIGATWAWLAVTLAPWESYAAGLIGSMTYTTDLIESINGNDGVGDFEWSWSLGVEEQFYLVWPIVLLLLVRFRRPAASLVILGVAVCAVWLLRASLIAGGVGHDRLFYSPDTHADALILGTMIAIALFYFPENVATRNAGAVAGVIGAAGLCLLLLRSGGLPFLEAIDKGAFGQAAVLSAALILLVAISSTHVIGKALSLKPLVFVGKLSYSLYLWNWLSVVIFVAIVGEEPLHTPLGISWAVALTGVAYASWKFVETPLRSKWGPPHGPSTGSEVVNRNSRASRAGKASAMLSGYRDVLYGIVPAFLAIGGWVGYLLVGWPIWLALASAGIWVVTQGILFGTTLRRARQVRELSLTDGDNNFA
ncbi:acyltransferase [Pseudarthrobacter equi]|uniref:acyltransferase family protein n=1 Tax=Pseudarthrobacter equi TaxID=728066 RepID=UPI0028D00124|nr:acyltransferase [Pseudarthrobacter equi]